MGLRGMSERLAAVGGQLRLRPTADGFCLAATVPADTAGDGGDGRGKRPGVSLTS
jgi:signal transduction histidine kinase